jgi:hypothetical protein
VNAAAVDWHEADAPRRLRFRDVIDRKTRAPVARAVSLGGADRVSERAAVIGMFVDELCGREHVLGVNDQ